MERAVSSTYLWCPFAGRGQLVPPPLAGRAVAVFLILSPSPHVFWFNPLPGICGSLAVLAGPEAGLAVWVFLRVAKTR